jgi:hypothetical protein
VFLTAILAALRCQPERANEQRQAAVNHQFQQFNRLH